MGWADAIASLAEVVNRVLVRFWGSETREEAKIEREVERLHAELAKALETGDAQRASELREQLLWLRDRVAARRLRK
jgi:protein-arginine kinase activator protein McsA